MEKVVEPSYKVIIRHSAPNQYDQLPQDTICKVISSDGSWDLYKQQSKNEAHPQWIRM